MAIGKNKFSTNINVKGFTLVELLVVIAIIAVLLSVLMPALSRVRAQAKKVVCSSQLKDIGTMLLVYAADNSGKIVSSSRYGYRWNDLLAPYYNKRHAAAGRIDAAVGYQIFNCPLEYAKRKRDTKLGPTTLYGYNTFFMCPTTDDGLLPRMNTPGDKYMWYSKFTDIKQLTTLPLFWDASSTPTLASTQGYPHSSLYKYGWDNGKQMLRRVDQSGPAANHPKSINYLFADGHAGGDGLWPYENTLHKPKSVNHYLNYFHPKHNLRE